MPDDRKIVHVELRADGHIGRQPILTGHPTTVIIHRPCVYTSTAEWTSYPLQSVMLLPHCDVQHPWAAITGWLRCLQQRPDHGALIVGHRAESEPEGVAYLRARALSHFLRDERQEWVEFAAAHGRVQDTQGFLEYLHRASAWDTSIPTITDTTDSATQRAVEAFQRTYNLAFHADIYEDGIIGEQTLGAVFEVAKTELTQWLELNQTSLDVLNYYVPAGQMIAEPAFGGGPWVQLLAIPFRDEYNLERVPAGAGLYPIARMIPLPTAEIEPPIHNVLQIALVDEWGVPLVRQAYEVTVDGDIRVGETDEQGRLAEPFLPPGMVTLRLGDGAPVLFHDLYQARQVFPLATEDDDLLGREAEYDEHHAADTEDPADGDDDDANTEVDEDNPLWDDLEEEDDERV